MDGVMLDQHSQNAKDLLENRDRMIREMAAAISTNRNGGEDDMSGNASHENSVSSQIVKLNEWNTWCKEIRKFSDGSTVTEDKICLFLPECIIPRFQKSHSAQQQSQTQAQQQSGQQQNSNGNNGSANASGSEDSSQVSETSSPIEIYSVLRSYVAVLVGQYLHQRRSGINSHPHPHGVLLKAYLQKFRSAASACHKLGLGHNNNKGSSSSNGSSTARHGSYHHHSSSRSHHHRNTQQRLIDSEYGERHAVPGLSPDVSDSDFDSFSDDGLSHSPDLLNGVVSGSGTGSGLGGTLGHNSRSLNGNSSGGLSGSARIEALIQSNVQLLRDSLQYVISMQTDKLSQQLTRENNELRSALDKQARCVTALSAMVDKIATWASTQAPDLAAEIAPSYRNIVSLSGSQPGGGAPSSTQSISSIQQSTSHPPQSVRRDTSTPTYMTTSSFGTANNVNDTIFGGNAMTATTSHDDANSVNIFKMAAATAAAARRNQIDQHTIPPHHPHSHNALQQHELPSSRRQNKAPTHAQQRHVQHQHAADPYMMTVPTNANANVMTNMEHLDMVIPQYRMSRDVSTVPDLWEEWDRGLNGGPIVRELEEKYGTRWRQNSAERKFFCLRKVIIDYVMRICGREGISIEEAVNRVEEIRKVNQFTSLQRLAEHLKKIRKTV
ncbi:transcriptional activator of glycolytic enzymes-domain-containing protein [Lipomyces tetrasporus]|uniref:Transcriptional activator of glycolytic enzymes-domain-containing protein n=1 Tax=Lipomyces tetrasporus TaxID=54092 RepID=A0AAD7QQ91_9ASCO|nr:transcriptional activator of glycolytic enzymes-domain-containing protein [Lipomyces tetrasporus]KAJ8099318.1 transcriptional activator of glycolytic enzymes-domain-containing protein [Lipomyces tetrasporus]